tara:strand:+ start:138 stop:332 length:195 start_codon:yes stop_codon:yes gene_type:complete
MNTARIPPHLVIEPSKEVIFYMPKKSDAIQDISGWIKELNLSDYRGMVINSKCMFNRLKDKGCK